MASFSTQKAAIFLVSVLAAGMLFYFLLSGIDQTVDPVSLLPQNTAVLVDIKEPAKDINKLKKSRLGMQVKSIDWRHILREIGVTEEYIRESMMIAEDFDLISRSYVFNELFSNRVLLGLIPLTSVLSEEISDTKALEEMVVLIARPRHPASLVDVLMDFSSDRLAAIPLGYRGRVIRKFTFGDKLSFFTTVTDGLFIASLSQELIELCINNSILNMTTGHTGLKENIAYLNLKERANDRDDEFVYVDMNNILPILQHTIYTWGLPSHNGYVDDIYPGGKSIVKHAVIFRTSGKRTRNYSGIVKFNEDILHIDSKVLHLMAPERDPVVSLIPDNNVVHLWMNIFNPDKLWNMLRNSRHISTGILLEPIEKLIRTRTEYTIDAILPLLGTQVSLNIAEIKSSGIIPMPKISLYLQVNDRITIEKLLKQLFAGLEVRQSSVRGIDIYSIILADGLMQPSFMFYDKFLVLADSRIQLVNMLSLHGKSLVASSLFKRVDTGLTEANNFVLYYRDAELIDGIKELVRWYGTLLGLFDDTSAFNNRIIVEKIILPLLDGMKMYKVKTLRVLTENNDVIFHSSQLLKDE